MSMQSSNLLPALQELPGGESGQHSSFREILTGLVNMDRAMYGAEFASAASFGMWAIFDHINVDDGLRETMTKAHQMTFDYEGTLTEHWREIAERGPESMEGFINSLKGKVAELDFKETLEQNGYTNVSIPDDPTHPIWDISAKSSDGQEVLFQVKSRVEGSASEIQGLMAENTDVHFAVSTELYDRISETTPELVDRLTDIGPTSELEGGIDEGLGILSGNLGIDVPDGVADIIPYAAAIIAASRLIYNVVKTEKEFKAADRTAKNKIQVVQTLTLMSRMGITTVLATAGGMGGGFIGSAVPGVGNLIGGIAGLIGGAGIGMYLNSHLKPHMLDLALNITGLTNDDLFYYKNKPRIDTVALSFQTTARELSAAAA